MRERTLLSKTAPEPVRDGFVHNAHRVVDGHADKSLAHQLIYPLQFDADADFVSLDNLAESPGDVDRHWPSHRQGIEAPVG